MVALQEMSGKVGGQEKSEDQQSKQAFNGGVTVCFTPPHWYRHEYSNNRKARARMHFKVPFKLKAVFKDPNFLWRVLQFSLSNLLINLPPTSCRSAQVPGVRRSLMWADADHLARDEPSWILTAEGVFSPLCLRGWTVLGYAGRGLYLYNSY